MSNLSDTAVSMAEHVGMLFYIIDPRKTTFPSIPDCPNYLQQCMPYMATLIVLEAVVNYMRGKTPNMADSVTSISSGIVMTCLGMLTQGLVITLYSWIHQHYRLIDLPWDSPTTWILAAVLTDFGYYWFHRASHEVAVLWAVHQHHHSSEEFNLSTAFRQPWFQGLFQIHELFYVPAALFVPPTQFIIHTQFVFLFQFWIHTELGGDLGPLGLIFNTSSYHRVHHGANRYCLDKNYAGVLSIWDRIFGTFEELGDPDELVYGLIGQTPFYNLVKHQLFYFGLIHEKALATDSWGDWVRAWIYGPGWFKGSGRLGDNDTCPEKPEREPHNPDQGVIRHLYVVIQLLGVFVLHDDLTFMFQEMSQGLALAVIVFIVWTLHNVSLQYDHDPLAVPMEVVRCGVSLAVYQAMGGWAKSHMSSTAFMVWVAGSLGATILASLAGGKNKVE